MAVKEGRGSNSFLLRENKEAGGAMKGRYWRGRVQGRKKRRRLNKTRHWGSREEVGFCEKLTVFVEEEEGRKERASSFSYMC